MELELTARFVLALEALACIWLGLMAWREAANEGLVARNVGPLLGLAAAALIIYGLVHS